MNAATPITVQKKLLAELCGTFALVFAGTTAIVVNSTGTISHAGVAITFGLVVFALISALGDISGAHLNPAVTISFWLAKRFPGRLVMPYIGAQGLGAILASGLVQLLFPGDTNLGGTKPTGPGYQSWVLEVILTSGLMFVILSVSTGAKEKGITAGLAIGSVIALAAMFAGPVSGASMNPARSLGPALISGQLDSLWIYLTAPVLGAILAVPLCVCLREPGCCTTPGTCAQ
jgi:aquaporin Z